MKVVFLGTVGYHPTDTRQTLSIILPEVGIIFDAGTGVFRAADYLQTTEVDIFLSHTHIDHVVGLTYFLDINHQHPLDHMRVHGEKKKLDAVREHLFAEDIFPVIPRWVEFVPLPTENRLVTATGAMLTWTPLPHPGGSIGYRVDWHDRSIAYITDTTASLDACYLDLIRGVDLLIHECNFTDEHATLALNTGHSHTTAVAQLARKAEVKQLALVHFNPLAPDDDPVNISHARSIHQETIIATDRMEIEF